MTELNSDKTRLKQSLDDASKGTDKTRIAPNKKEPVSTSKNDRTRIAPKKNPASTVIRPGPLKQQADDKKTRMANNLNQQPDQIDESTRINPGIKKDVDKTRIAPTERNTDEKEQIAHSDKTTVPPHGLPLEPINLDEMGEHGTLKKRFVLESVLGAGGMGIVYKAKDLLKVEAKDRDPYVAIKVLGEEFKTHPDAFISLQRESRKSQRIAHPNIVNVHDFDRDGDMVFMTMEFLDGSPLDKLIRQYQSTGLPTEDAWIIIKGMCAALSYAHAEKIIHSDFKPGNVFVTKKGLAKVFDFGIARAVARVEQAEDSQDDKTVFDAANLGALTPAYASLEMLEGKEPDVRDDIYALGCVAYELFTAEHPYKKIPADEAAKQGLKPKRISNISKAQWRAIEQAIAFKREDRIETVDKFVEAISPKSKTTNIWVTAFAFLLSAAITVYFVYFQEKKVEPGYSEFDIRNELELKIRVDYLKQNLERLINSPAFTTRWAEETWKDVSDLTTLTKGEDPWVDEKKNQIYQLYIDKINNQIGAFKYTSAQELIDRAKPYTSDATELDSLLSTVLAALKKQQSRKAAIAEKDRIRKINLAKKQKQDQLKQQQLKKTGEQAQQKKVQATKTFDLALKNVNAQLKCIERLNMRNIETAVVKLREVDIKRYNGLENNLVNSLAACIVKTGKLFPQRAIEAKKQGLRLFKSSAVLSAITIKARDACDLTLAGLGARGKRAICKDKIKQTGTHGPELVVIPGSSKIDAFAIGKYEISMDELNSFCKKTSSCTGLKIVDGKLPATGIDISTVKNYVKWMSRQTGKKYRLPTRGEWVYAAKSRRKVLDANRNCKLSTRGIQKGEGLIKTSIGKQNGWGLVNYVGNVQEWVYDKGRKLVAVGGSYAQPMDNCDITTKKPHSGSADKITGFRVVREVRSGS